ncbi:polysaccharide deacetylase [Actinomadura sp.]|jgi:peptidoglycan/xylan/chitin deacetylase (PgdA/CDA1 family)|uniref:polysaccharide deacetylase n=1 Tax=Actinomadura sp. TaxID=1989 RepID=UPI00334E4817
MEPATPSWLPEGKTTAFALTIPVDCETVVLAEGRRFAQHPLPMSHQVYEIQRGVPRLLGMLDALGIKATFFVPGWTLERHPQLVEPIVGAGHELAHHSYSHRPPTDMSESEERADFERALEVMAAFGVTPAGHRAAYWSASSRTLDIVAEYGLRYDTSLMGDDSPYLVRRRDRDVVELPCHWILDDFDHYAFLPQPRIGRNVEAPQTAVGIWRAELDGLRRYGGLYQLTCHAFLSGRAGRTLALRGLLEYALSCGDVEFMTCGEAARRALAAPPARPRAGVTETQ